MSGITNVGGTPVRVESVDMQKEGEIGVSANVVFVLASSKLPGQSIIGRHLLAASWSR